VRANFLCPPQLFRIIAKTIIVVTAQHPSIRQQIFIVVNHLLHVFVAFHQPRH
jgi:hypothetical protein